MTYFNRMFYKRVFNDLYQMTVRMLRGMTLEYSSSIFVNCHARKGMSHFQGFARGSRTSYWKPVASSSSFYFKMKYVYPEHLRIG